MPEITTEREARNLSDLSDWAIVGYKTWDEGRLLWWYTMPDREVAAYHRAVASGAVVPLQRRHQDGSITLYAKLAAPARRKAA